MSTRLHRSWVGALLVALFWLPAAWPQGAVSTGGPRSALVRQAPATTIYVNANNTSGIEDGTAAHPFATIQEGLGVAANGNTVSVAAGSYFERVTLKNGVRLLGAGAAVTKIDGSNQDNAAVTASNAGPGTSLEGFTITNGTGKWVGGYTYGGGLYVISSTVTLKNCIVIGNHASNGAGGLQVTNSSIQVENCTFRDNGGWWGGAISVSGSQADIRRTIVDNNSNGYGGTVYIAGQTQFTLTNSLIMHSGSVAAIGIADAHATIINDTIVDNHSPGVATGVYGVGGVSGTADITNTILWGNQDDLINVSAAFSDIEDGDPGTGNLSTYPLFTLPAFGYYSLRAGSQCIDAGTSQGAPADDLNGTPRPLDGNGDLTPEVDLGAYEFDPAHPPTATALYLPLIFKPEPGLVGQVTFNGAPASGVLLDLRFFDGSAWSTGAQTTTDAHGNFAFRNVPALAPGQKYYVRYLNTVASTRLFTWHTQMLTAYTGNSAVQIGSFDLADIKLLQPSPGASVHLPYTFQWAPRPATPTDNYRFELFDPNGPADWLSAPVGYAGGFTLTGLPGGFGTGAQYGWDVIVNGPDGGFGGSFYYNPVAFNNSGLVSSQTSWPNASSASPSFADMQIRGTRR